MDGINPRLQHNFFLLLLAGAAIIMFFIFRPFLTALILAFSFSVVFRPFHNWVLKTCKERHSLSALITVAVIVIAILTPLAFIGILLFQEAQGLYISLISDSSSAGLLERTVGNLEAYLARYVPNLSINVSEYVEYGLAWIIDHLGSVFSGLLNLFIGLFIMIITLFYLLRDGDGLRRKYLLLSPLSNIYDEQILTKLTTAINSVVKGSLVIAVLQGTLAALGVWVFGLPNPIIWGVCATIASLIPGLGTALVMTPAILYLFFTGNVGAGLGLLVWQAVVVGLVDNVMSPYLINRGLKIHPLLILLSVLGGITFFGPIGFLLGPIILALTFALLDIYPLILNR